MTRLPPPLRSLRSLRSLQVTMAALLALSLSGCIILPVGHRHHHGKGRHASEPTIIVIPAQRGRDHAHRHHRHDRRDRRD